MVKTAILVDGGFFLKRYVHTYGRKQTAEQTAKNLFTMSIKHLENKGDLYRIFFYDCPPLDKRAHHPITKIAIDFSKTPTFKFMNALHQELVKLRKLALRTGRLSDGSDGWIIKPGPTKNLLNGKIQMADIKEEDVTYSIRQKGVDMRIGLDIASLSYKKLVDRIVLVTGDSDFVPAAKLARREGIDVVLDPMWQRISDDLFEHIDGLKSVCPKPKNWISK